MLQLTLIKKITEDKMKEEEEQKLNENKSDDQKPPAICKTTEENTELNLDGQHDKKEKKIKFQIVIDEMPKKGFVGKIEIEPDDTKKDELDGNSSHDTINVEDDDDTEIPCSQIVCVSPYAKFKNVELNNNNPDVFINTEYEKEHTVKDKELEGKNEDIHKNKEQKTETVETNKNKGAPSSTEWKGDEEINDDICNKENKENETDINSNSVNKEIAAGCTNNEPHVEGDRYKKENQDGGDDPSKAVDQGVES